MNCCHWDCKLALQVLVSSPSCALQYIESFLGHLGDSMLRYGVKVWECGRHAMQGEQVQCQLTVRVFLRVGRLYPNVSHV